MLKYKPLAGATAAPNRWDWALLPLILGLLLLTAYGGAPHGPALPTGRAPHALA